LLCLPSSLRERDRERRDALAGLRVVFAAFFRPRAAGAARADAFLAMV
jgi:hypothetical protein